MLELESVNKLKEQLDGLISSIENENLNDSDYTFFVKHKYLVVNLHAYTERSKLDKFLKRSSDKLLYRKQYNLYQKIEVILSKKPHECSSTEMFSKLIECKKLVEDYM